MITNNDKSSVRQVFPPEPPWQPGAEVAQPQAEVPNSNSNSNSNSNR